MKKEEVAAVVVVAAPAEVIPAVVAEVTIEELLAGLSAGPRKDALIAAVRAAAKEEADRKVRLEAQDCFEDYFQALLESVEARDWETLTAAGAVVTVKLTVTKDEAEKVSTNLDFAWGVVPSQVTRTASNGNGVWNEDRVKTAFVAGSSGKAGVVLGITGSTVAASIANYCGVPYAQARESFRNTGIIPRRS